VKLLGAVPTDLPSVSHQGETHIFVAGRVDKNAQFLKQSLAILMRLLMCPYFVDLGFQVATNHWNV